MRDDSIEMRPFRGRPGVPPWSAPASLHEQRLALQAEAAALIVAAWERIHDADVLTTRMGPIPTTASWALRTRWPS